MFSHGAGMFSKNGTGWTKLAWLNFWKLSRVGKIVTGYFLRNFQSRNLTAVFYLSHKKISRDSSVFKIATDFWSCRGYVFGEWHGMDKTSMVKF